MNITKLLLSVIICITVFKDIKSQTIKENSSYSKESDLFGAFNGGINALYSGRGTKGSVDLSVQTYHYFMVTGKRDNVDSADVYNSRNPLKQQYKGFEFFLINRAAIDFDSVLSVANDYVTSLQASPLTMRIMKEFFFTRSHEVTPNSFTPVVSLKLTGDVRAIPYGSVMDKNIRVGGSSHMFLTFSSQFIRMELDDDMKIIDKGIMYLQPSIGIAIGSTEMIRTVVSNQSKNLLLSTECKLGFRSYVKTVNDLSFLFRYTLTDIIGPQFRAGIILSSID